MFKDHASMHIRKMIIFMYMARTIAKLFYARSPVQCMLIRNWMLLIRNWMLPWQETYVQKTCQRAYA